MKKKFIILSLIGLLFSCNYNPEPSVSSSNSITGSSESSVLSTEGSNSSSSSGEKEFSISDNSSINLESSSLESSTNSSVNSTINSQTSSSQTSSSSSSLNDDNDVIDEVDEIQEGLILHAFNLKYSTIKSRLKSIKDAGYIAIQTSPVQQPKDYSPNYTDREGQWWKLYQPLSFSIAEKSWLGTKNELTDLCKEAEKYGLKIICDIVSNHMANNDNEGRVVNPNIAQYEKEIYNNKDKYFHDYYSFDENTIKGVVQCAIGLPDLATENEYVQGRVISLLKECIDCGVDGFRFDAAKHIETPDDGEYSSNYWPNVISNATEYARSKGVDLYSYAEILNTPGKGREFSSYTKYLSITDNVTGNNIRSAIKNKNASGTVYQEYKSKQPSDKLVLWSESHDTFEDNSSSNVSSSDINKTWALVASRKEASALYFIRPGSTMNSIANEDYQSDEVKAVNLFHNYFNGCDEKVGYSSDYSYVERFNNHRSGIVVVNCKGTNGSVNIRCDNLKDGTYIDHVSGNTFICNNHILTGNISNSGICVLYNEDNDSPVISFSNLVELFSTETYSLNVNVTNATSSTYQINNQQPISFSNSISINIGSDMAYGDQVTIKFVISNSEKVVEKIVTIRKEKVTNTKLYFDPSNCSWVFADNALPAFSINQKEYQAMTKESDDLYYFTTTENITSLRFSRLLPDGRYYNEFNVDYSSLNNGMTFVVNSNFDGGTWVNS